MVMAVRRPPTRPPRKDHSPPLQQRIFSGLRNDKRQYVWPCVLASQKIIAPSRNGLPFVARLGWATRGIPLQSNSLATRPPRNIIGQPQKKDFVLCRIAWDLFCGHGPWPSAPWIIGPRRNGIPYVAIATAHELLNFTYGHCPWPQRPPPCEHWRASQ